MFHSTTTVPLNFDGSFGRRTTNRVTYPAFVVGESFISPLRGNAFAPPASAYAVAVPDAEYSCST